MSTLMWIMWITSRMMNVIGQPIDGMNELDMKGAYPIHREAPKFDELSTHKEMLATGIKVIDLLEPYMKGYDAFTGSRRSS